MIGRTYALGVDIGEKTVRLVVLRAAGAGYALVRATSFPRPADDDIAGLLAAWLRASGVGRPRVAAALPAAGCIYKTASLPPGKATEVAQVARFEAETQFPLPLHELTWDFTVLPEPSGRNHAVIVGARRAVVDERMAVLDAAGITPAVLLPAPLAAAKTVHAGDETTLLVLVGTSWSDLCLYEGERLHGCRSVLAGDPEAEGWAERIAREARPWIAGHEGTLRIVLQGDTTADTAEALAQTTGMPVAEADPWDEIADPRRETANLTDPPTAYATAIGLAISALERHADINLLPATLREERTRIRKLAWTTVGLALVLALLIPVALSGHRHLQGQREALQKVQMQVRAARSAMPVAPDAGILAVQQVVNGLGTRAQQPLDILRALSAELPEGMTLTDLSFDRGKAVVVKGRADSHAMLATAMNAINGMGIFERALLNHATGVRSDDEQGYDFQITCTLPAGQDPTLGTGRQARTTQARGTTTR